MDLPTTSIPPSQPHTHTLIFLHGRGDTVPSFTRGLSEWRSSTGQNLAETFPTFRFVFPQAPTRTLAADPGTRWPQWFDVWNPRDFTLHEDLSLEGLKQSVPAIRQLLTSEANLLGGRYDKLILAGISMGGATGTHTLLNLDRRLGAFMGFSSRCPFGDRSLGEIRGLLGLDSVPGDDDVIRDTPVLLEHCVDDPLVKIDRGRALRDTLVGFGARVEWREYGSGGHWFKDPEGMDDVVAFLRREVLGEEVGAEQVKGGSLVGTGQLKGESSVGAAQLKDGSDVMDMSSMLGLRIERCGDGRRAVDQEIE